MSTRLYAGLVLLLLASMVLAACQSLPTPPTWMLTSTASLQSRELATITPSVTTPDPTTPLNTSTSTSSSTPTQTATSTVTPPPPPGFSTSLLRSGVIPQSYIEDACSYLNQRWSLQGSPPGTVVLPVMFHSITRRASSITDIKDISQQQFDDFVAYAQSLGFKTITVPELIAFLEDNARIPARSMILIFDDRRLGVVVNHVQPVWEKLDWRVTLAYITGPVVPESEWHGLEELAKTGRIDVQAHGYYHRGDTYIVETTPLDVIEQEVYGPIEVIEKHFGYQPTAFIWPGGNFTDLSVDIARQAGYRVGFTVFSRGPLLYNWIPLGEPEIAVGDPLLVLPRAWSYEVNFKLYQAAQIGDQARQFAVQNYPLEATWYRSVCGGELPSLESSLDSQPTP